MFSLNENVHRVNTLFAHQSKRFFAIVTVFVSLMSVQYTGLAQAAGSCRTLFLSLSKELDVSHESIRQEYLNNPRLLYLERKQLNFEAGEFLASNEFDWSKAKTNFSNTDVLLGFATNSAWDLAVRTRAKYMVLADWSSDVLMNQEFLFRSIFTFAETREEFLELVTGISRDTYEVKMKRSVKGSLGSLINGLSWISDSLKSNSKEDSEQKSGLIQRLMEKYQDKKEQVSKAQMSYLINYLNALRSNEAFFVDLYEEASDPFRTSYLLSDLGRFFLERYKTADSEVNKEIERSSFLASAENYNFLRELYLERTYYMQFDITNTGAYSEMAKMDIFKNAEKILFSASNIFHVIGLTNEAPGAERLWKKSSEQIAQMMYASLPQLNQLEFAHTVGVTNSHEYKSIALNRAGISTDLETKNHQETSSPKKKKGFFRSLFD